MAVRSQQEIADQMLADGKISLQTWTVLTGGVVTDAGTDGVVTVFRSDPERVAKYNAEIKECVDGLEKFSHLELRTALARIYLMVNRAVIEDFTEDRDVGPSNAFSSWCADIQMIIDP